MERVLEEIAIEVYGVWCMVYGVWLMIVIKK